MCLALLALLVVLKNIRTALLLMVFSSVTSYWPSSAHKAQTSASFTLYSCDPTPMSFYIDARASGCGMAAHVPMLLLPRESPGRLSPTSGLHSGIQVRQLLLEHCSLREKIFLPFFEECKLFLDSGLLDPFPFL